jgi:hypothetical protein
VSSKQSIYFFGSNRNKPKLNLFRLFFDLFCKTKIHFFRFVSDRYQNNRNKQNFVQTNRKNLQKCSLLGGVRTETKAKLYLFRLFFGMFYRETKVLFQFISVFRTGIETTETNKLMVWGIKKVDILKNVLLFRLVFCLFRLFRHTETPCFDIKAKQPKQTSCFGWCRCSFGCFDTKLVSEDTLCISVSQRWASAT